MSPRIFICGSGRSGTWILYKALGSHQAVHTFPREMRFLIDPDGLRDLVDALTTRYHPTQASEALYRFERLMRVYMTVPQRPPYRGFDLANWLGGDHYWRELDRFCSRLVAAEFEGSAWQVEPEREGRAVETARRFQQLARDLQGESFTPHRLTLPRRKLKVGRYFADRLELTRLAADFTDGLFLHAAQQNGKQTWAEKTPQHLLTLDFIHELFPDSVAIHIMRDPRGVVHSLTKQSWAPNDVRGASLWLRNVYDRWHDLKASLAGTPYAYHELKLEDLAAAPGATLAKVADWCGLENDFQNVPEIRMDRVNYWLDELSREDIALINDILGPHIDLLGYERQPQPAALPALPVGAR